MNSGLQMQVSPLTRGAKAIIVANVAIWLGLVVVLQRLILGNNAVFEILALVPAKVVTEFWIWQPLTYMFLHSTGIFHILFNMLVVWWCGSELEQRWGTKFFLIYYGLCGVGAGLIYVLGTTLYYLLSGSVLSLATPLVGASGATYGLLLAYGLIFGDRVIYFMMLFPMKARYFTMILGGVELMTLLDSGFSTDVAHLAHLGGLVVGFLILTVVAKWRSGGGSVSTATKRNRKLKLVVNNDRHRDANGPKYWN